MDFDVHRSGFPEAVILEFILQHGGHEEGHGIDLHERQYASKAERLRNKSVAVIKCKTTMLEGLYL